jgi:putative transposase
MRRELQRLQERCWEEVEILVIYIDGQRFGSHHILSVVGVDVEGKKHIMGIEAGATENAAAVKRVLVRLRDQGLALGRKYLFVIDGARALRTAIEELSVPISPCSAAAITNCATFWRSCLGSNRAKPAT